MEAWSLEDEVKWGWGQGKSAEESAHHLPSSIWRCRSAKQSTEEPRQRVARAVAGDLLESGEAISCSGPKPASTEDGETPSPESD